MKKNVLLRLLTAVVAAILATSGFAAVVHAQTAGTLPHTLKPGKLSVCLYAGFAPFSSKDDDGKWVGWDVSYLQDFAQTNGLEFEPVEVPEFAGIWNRPAANTCDISASGISDFAARRQEAGPAVGWTNPYYEVVRALAVREGDESKLTSIDDLDGKTVIATINSSADLDLQNWAKLRNVNVNILPTTDELEAGKRVRDGVGQDAPFAYGGGYGSIEHLVKELGGLSLVWPHCFMGADGSIEGEPFSFATRAASEITDSLNTYIATHDYEGTPSPDLGCLS